MKKTALFFCLLFLGVLISAPIVLSGQNAAAGGAQTTTPRKRRQMARTAFFIGGTPLFLVAGTPGLYYIKPYAISLLNPVIPNNE